MITKLLSLTDPFIHSCVNTSTNQQKRSKRQTHISKNLSQQPCMSEQPNSDPTTSQHTPSSRSEIPRMLLRTLVVYSAHSILQPRQQISKRETLRNRLISWILRWRRRGAAWCCSHARSWTACYSTAGGSRSEIRCWSRAWKWWCGERG